MLYRSCFDRRPGLDREAIEHSLAAAARASRPAALSLTPAEAEAATQAILRVPYERALAEGRIAPAPADFTGWRIGAITVLGPADSPERWEVHNPTPSRGVLPRYTVSEASLVASYAAGDLKPPT